MLQPQKHVGLPRCSALSSIRTWILCPQAPLVHPHHSSFLFTNVCLRKFLALRRYPFPLRALRLRTAPRQTRRRLALEQQRTYHSNLKPLEFLHKRKKPPLAFATAVFCRPFTDTFVSPD